MEDQRDVEIEGKDWGECCVGNYRRTFFEAGKIRDAETFVEGEEKRAHAAVDRRRCMSWQACGGIIQGRAKRGCKQMKAYTQTHGTGREAGARRD